MKKLLTGIFCALTMTFTACGAEGGSKTSAQSTPDASESRVVIAYFSATGTTKGVAEKIASVTGGRLVEITPTQPYTSADLDWRNKKSRSSVEMADLSSRPAISNAKLDSESFDVIYIGFPIWWYTAPTIINTFIEANDLQGKKIIPFATSGGSTIEKSVKDLRAAYPALTFTDGALLNMPTTEEIANLAE